MEDRRDRVVGTRRRETIREAMTKNVCIASNCKHIKQRLVYIYSTLITIPEHSRSLSSVQVDRRWIFLVVTMEIGEKCFVKSNGRIQNECIYVARIRQEWCNVDNVLDGSRRKEKDWSLQQFLSINTWRTFAIIIAMVVRNSLCGIQWIFDEFFLMKNKRDRRSIKKERSSYVWKWLRLWFHCKIRFVAGSFDMFYRNCSNRLSFAFSSLLFS